VLAVSFAIRQRLRRSAFNLDPVIPFRHDMTTRLRERFQEIWRRTTAGNLREGIVTLAGGNGVAQLVTLSVAPILTRLYSPADYGALTVLVAVVSVLAILATGRFHLAIPLPESVQQARQLLITALALTALSSTLIALLVWAFADRIFETLRIPGAVGYWWFIPVATAGIAMYETLYHWALRLKQFRLLTRTRVTQAITGSTTSIGVGVFSTGPFGLLLGALFFQAAGICRLARFARAPLPNTIKTAQVLAPRFPSTVRAYFSFASFSCLAAFLNTLGVALAPVLLARLYGEEAGGSYGFAYRLITVPMLLVGNAISQVFLAEAAPNLANRPEYIRHLHRAITKRTVWFAAALVAVGVLSPFLFPLVFGARWAQAGVFAAWMTIFCAAQLVVSPVSNLAVLLRRQDLQCALDALRVLVIIPSLVVPHMLGATATQTVASYSLSMFGLYGVYYAVYAHLARSLVSSKA
jgi:O-antigen/teichoic acid export membrane protein